MSANHTVPERFAPTCATPDAIAYTFLSAPASSTPMGSVLTLRVARGIVSITAWLVHTTRLCSLASEVRLMEEFRCLLRVLETG